ncbi:MAG: AbrB/MazE/SpoVT family DNA-binding domain-containing protein [Actinobacteria bacterium]|nr:AbrB/MazE/SpoVT family DNA-binding domain-containing protein [Actinomycetota bacterium]MBU4386453.1 AbrB/MazE/SpoVT family DNA-binding domain-containing protein [Actinomycetota bacterium]MBU4489842.1 AbrB/MazE/SpoVT family DNA-binding domain-containing protein [Actinomycetota bacterium]MCG2795348.1 AbrB/MazE/SpoVT family DNA-binding domain-containing protein [Actinomycetes bacterium]
MAGDVEEIVKVGERGTITIPAAVRKIAGISPGDVLRVAISTITGTVTLTPQVTIDRDQAWYWTPEWQKGEREADEDIAAGRVYEMKADGMRGEMENW